MIRRYGDAYSVGGSWSNFDGSSYDGSPFAFTGRYKDQLTGLHWNLHRWYDPFTGRWLTQDPIGFAGGDTNLYRYVHNSPTNFVDPSGLEEESWDARWSPLAWIGRWLDRQSCSLDTDIKGNTQRLDTLGQVENSRFPRGTEVTASGNFNTLEGTKATMAGMAAAAIIINASALGGGFIRVTPDRMSHVLERHFAGGTESAGKSLFSNSEDVLGLLGNAVSKCPVKQARGRNFQRIIDAGRIIGRDITTGKATSVYTVITDATGNLVTMFPGMPRI